MAKMPPNIPLHCIAHHFYHDYGRTVQLRLRKKVPIRTEAELETFLRTEAARRTDGGGAEGDNADQGGGESRILLMAVTHRYERQFTTSVLVTGGSRWPYKQEPSSTATTSGTGQPSSTGQSPSQTPGQQQLWGVNVDGTRFGWKQVNPLKLCYSTRRPPPHKSAQRVPAGVTTVRPSAARGSAPSADEATSGVQASNSQDTNESGGSPEGGDASTSQSGKKSSTTGGGDTSSNMDEKAGVPAMISTIDIDEHVAMNSAKLLRTFETANSELATQLEGREGD